MRRTVRAVRLTVPPARAFAACLRLLEEPDRRRDIVARVAKPSPPRVGSVIVTTVRGRSGAPERELRSQVVVLDRPREVATATLDSLPEVRTALRVEAHGSGSLVTLTSEVEGGLGAGRGGSMLDSLLFGRAQRRAARATLRRLEELAAGG